jgi:hypothetical protein
MTEATTKEEKSEKRHDEHLQDIESGAGCTEIWDRLSEQREE